MASQNYVLAEYGGQTRKIVVAGPWNQKAFGVLIKEIKSKFNVTFNIDIEVFDKQNNKYFSIDRSEMREIPKGGLIRVVKQKTRKSPANQSPQQAQQKPAQRKPAAYTRGPQRPGMPMVPPGAPPYSKADDAKRNAWKIGSQVQIYSEGQMKWQKGEIVKIFKDNEGEWLVIKYAGFRTKEIQRFSNYIRPMQPATATKKQQTANNKQKAAGGAKADSKAKSGGKAGEAKKGEASKKSKKPKVKKPSTQDKYMKMRKAPQKLQMHENEIYISGNTKHIKKYIDRAWLLLHGKDKGEAPTPHDIKVSSGQSDEEDDDEEQQQQHEDGDDHKNGHDEAAAGSNEDEEDYDDEEHHHEEDEEEEEEVLIDAADLKRPPTKVYDVIHLFGAPRSMNAIVTTVEIIKRIMPGLYQVTQLQSEEVKELWTPTEQGLHEVETVRYVTRLRISLATKEGLASLDKEQPGYQEPVGDLDLMSSFNYQYPDESATARGGRSRGRGRGRGAGRGAGGKGRGGGGAGGKGRGN